MRYSFDKLYHGACYYPELWDENIIAEDIRLMKETGINVVRIGEFWWSTVEPNEGEYKVEIITKWLDLFYENSIQVIMCTPTPTPPIWVTDKHPERLHINEFGQQMMHGARQHICTNNPVFRKLCELIIEKISISIGNHPAIIMWQLDNEFKAHVSECYCDNCKIQWHEWLEKEYGCIKNLNKNWGTRIWSEEYRRFDQVPLPLENTPFLHHPSLVTKYKIFHRMKIAEFALLQAKIIKKHSNLPITTNGGMGFSVHNEWLFDNLDMVGFDTYANADNYPAFLINCDLWRGLKPNQPFWLLETSASHAGHIKSNPNPHPNGYLVAEAVSNYALGGIGFLYWLWRGQRVGCEINHSAVISTWGKPSIGYQNVLKVEATRKKIESFILNTKLSQSELAFTYSDMARIMMETEPMGLMKNHYRTLTTEIYKRILNTGISRDLIPENGDFSNYKILFTPFIKYLSTNYIFRAKEFVRKGGVWIVGPMTGGRTSEHTVTIDSALDGDLEEFAGVEALYTFPIDKTNSYGTAFNITAPLSGWSTVFRLKCAKSIGSLSGNLVENETFISERTVESGKVIMIGSLPTGDSGNHLLQNLFEHYYNEVSEQFYELTLGTIAVSRFDENNKYLVLINMDGNGGTCISNRTMTDIFTGEIYQNKKIEISRYEYRIMRID